MRRTPLAGRTDTGAVFFGVKGVERSYGSLRSLWELKDNSLVSLTPPSGGRLGRGEICPLTPSDFFNSLNFPPRGGQPRGLSAVLVAGGIGRASIFFIFKIPNLLLALRL